MNIAKITLHRNLLPALLVAVVSLTLSNCDLSPIIQPKATQPLSSLSFTTAENSSLSSDISATIAGSVVSVVIPDSALTTKLTPTATFVNSDYTLSPSGSFVLQDGMPLTVTDAKTNASAYYTLAVAVDQATLPAVSTSVITSFVLKKAANSALSSDITATVTPSTVSVVIPYSVANTPLTPTVTLASSTDSFSPASSFVLRNNTILTVTDSATSQRYSYTLHVSIDPSTVPASTQNLIASFLIEKANNPAITQDIDATVNTTTVSLVLPYSDTQLSLLPTVSFSSSGYTLSPSGSFVMRNGTPLYVIDSSTNQTYTYTLQVSIDPSTVPAVSLISSFVLQASQNSALTSDATAVVSGTDIYLTLPYTVVKSSTPLTPTVSFISSDYTITPSTAYAMTNGMTLTLTQLSTGKTYQYTLNVAMDPATVP